MNIRCILVFFHAYHLKFCLKKQENYVIITARTMNGREEYCVLIQGSEDHRFYPEEA